jgi:uncharacterized protein (DUF2141 family)
MERSVVNKVLSVIAASGGAFLIAASAVLPLHAQDTSRATRTVVVVVRNLRSDSGELAGGLYTSARLWLGEDRAAADCHAPIRRGEARCVFEIPAGGHMAFAAMHDEDGDGQLDRDFLGLPQEGYAFSNDVREPFGPPSFEAASFSPPGVTPFIVHARYGI